MWHLRRGWEKATDTVVLAGAGGAVGGQGGRSVGEGAWVCADSGDSLQNSPCQITVHNGRASQSETQSPDGVVKPCVPAELQKARGERLECGVLA